MNIRMYRLSRIIPRKSLSPKSLQFMDNKSISMIVNLFCIPRIIFHHQHNYDVVIGKSENATEINHLCTQYWMA